MTHRLPTPFRPVDGHTVTCPEDRGDPGYHGIVVSSGSEIHENTNGQPYVWVSVRNPQGNTAVWPSSRLSG